MKSNFNYELVRQTMKDKNITQAMLADYLTQNGITTPIDTVKSWFRKDNDRRVSPEIIKIRLIGRCLSLDANQMINGFNSDISSVKEIPIVGEASCGIPEPNSYQDYDQKTYCSADIWNEDMYAVIASGDSMYDLIERGDEVICDPRADILSGDIVHYEFNGESAIKVYFKEEKFGVVRFVPYNRSGGFNTLSFSASDEVLQNIKMIKVIKVNKSMENNRKSRLRVMGLI